MEDAEVLKELYETIKQNSKADYAGIIEQRASYRICIICRRSGRIW